MLQIKRLGISLLLVVGLMMSAASMAQQQRGLVNVNVGDVTVLENVGIGVAVQAALALCPNVQIGSVGVIARQIARQEAVAFCDVQQGDAMVPVTIN